MRLNQVLAGLVLLIAAITAAAAPSRSIGSVRAFAVISIAIGCGLLYRSYSHRELFSKPFYEWGARLISTLAAYTIPNPPVQFLLVSGTGFCSIGLASDLLEWNTAQPILYGIGAFMLLCAGTLDIYDIASNAIKKIWAPIAGKIITVTFGVALACCAISLAKGTAHSITHTDPKYFTEFTALLAATRLPVLYTLAAAAVLNIFALLQWLNLCFLMAIRATLQKAEHFASAGMRTQLGVMRRNLFPLSQDGEQTRSLLDFHMTANALRPFAIITVAVALGYGSGGILELWAPMKPHLTKFLVFMEYRRNVGCPSVALGASIAYMENDNVSVAVPGNDDFRFEVRKCGL